MRRLIKFWGVSSRQVVRTAHTKAWVAFFGVLMLANLPGELLADPFLYVANEDDATITVLDTVDHTIVATIPLGGTGPNGVAVSSDGTRLYVANNTDDTVSVIDTANNGEIALIDFNDADDVVVSLDGSKVYVSSNQIDRVSVIDTTSNSVSVAVPVGSSPFDLAIHPDGTRVYVANRTQDTVTVIGTANDSVLETIILPGANGVAVHPDGTKIYVTNGSGDSLSVVDAGTSTVTATIPVGNDPVGVAVHPDGSKAYVANTLDDSVTVVDLVGNTVTAVVSVGVFPRNIEVHPDGTRVYVVNTNANTVSVIGTTDNQVIDTLPVGNGPFDLAIGPLFVPTTEVAAAVLPSSRSVQPGQTATTFASIVNAGDTAASKCSITPPPGLAASFSFRSTDPATNIITGSPDLPVFIPAGEFRTFALSLTPSAPLPQTELSFTYSCENTAGAPSVSGVNTFVLSSSATPEADIIALAATSGGIGIVDTPLNGAAAFSVATFNLGATSPITTTVRTTPANLPMVVGICQTDPATAACITPLGASIDTTIAAGGTPLFGVFIGGQNQAVPLDPANSRILVEFLDANGTLRGSTSVAVQTVSN